MFRTVIASEPVSINAPIDTVWTILVDVDRYGEWNPFLRTYRKTNVRVGSPVHLDVRLGRRDRRQTQVFDVIEPPARLFWSTTVGNGFLLRALREQRLEKRSETRCIYLNSDTLAGPLAPLVVLLFGRAMHHGFAEAGRALKQRAEDER